MIPTPMELVKDAEAWAPPLEILQWLIWRVGLRGLFLTRLIHCGYKCWCSVDIFWETLLFQVQGACTGVPEKTWRTLGFKRLPSEAVAELRLEGCGGGCQADRLYVLGLSHGSVSLLGLKCQDPLFGSFSPFRPRPCWHCFPLRARTADVIYDHHLSFLRQPIPQEVLESFFCLNDLFYCLSPRVVEILYHLWNPIKILFPYFPFMMTGISFLKGGLRKWACLGGSQALGRVRYWGSLSLRGSTGIQSWQHPSRSCGPFSTGGILSRASYHPGETAVAL